MRVSRLLPRLTLVALTPVFVGAEAISLSKSQPISFYQQTVERELEGLGIRSDGRIIQGPVMTDLAGDPITTLWWDWESSADPDIGWIGSGPDGEILRMELEVDAGIFKSAVWADTPANHVFVVKSLTDGKLLAGGNPNGALFMLSEDGTLLQQASLPADSVFDILIEEQGEIAWVATGNPALLFRVDLTTFVKSEDALPLADRGIERWGAVRDRNIRSLAFDAEGRILAGSAPSGNIYRFDLTGSPALILLDQESGEVTDIHLADNGDVLATVIDAKGTARRRVMQSSQVQPTTPEEEESDEQKPSPVPSIMEAPPVEKFSGRSDLILLPRGGGLPETVSSRSDLALYRIVPYAGGYLLPGGDDGELAGYDPIARRALIFTASDAAQLNDMVALADSERFLVMANNPTTLSVLDFSRRGTRRLETKSINLQTLSEMGAVRFNRLRGLDPADIKVEMRANRGRDPMEGWTPWTEAAYVDGGWTAKGLTGRNVQIAITLPDDMAADAELDQATLFFLPQNRKPVLRSFHIVSPNFALQARGTPLPSVTTTLAQVVNNSPSGGSTPADRRRQALMGSSLVPAAGAQVVVWTVSDPDGDNLVSTFSIRHQDEDSWRDLQVANDSDWFQFDRRTLTEGIYFTRLIVEETSPRSAKDRHRVEFSADDLVVDLTAPEILASAITRHDGHWQVQAEASDAYSLLTGMRVVFNNGFAAATAHPVDGILDSTREAFELPIAVDDLTGATQAEIYLEDSASNIATVRINL